MDPEPYVATWLAPGDQAAVESLVLSALTELGGSPAQSRADLTFGGGLSLHMEAHVVPNAQRHPAMTAHVDLGPGNSAITTQVTLTLVARHAHEAASERFANRCLEICTSAQEATGSVPQE